MQLLRSLYRTRELPMGICRPQSSCPGNRDSPSKAGIRDSQDLKPLWMGPPFPKATKEAPAGLCF